MSKIPIVLVPPNTNVAGGVMSRNFGMFSDLQIVGSGVAVANVAGGVLPMSYDEYGAEMLSALGISPAAWFQFNKGITVTGAGVSQWSDQSGNARHLLQAVDTNRPALQADGSILFDGVDNFLKCAAFTLNQPCTICILGRQVTWTLNDKFFDGDTADSLMLAQGGTTPELFQFAGTVSAVNNALAVNTYGVIQAVYNGASSTLRINNTSVATTVGAQNAAGFTLGAAGSGAGNFGNIQAKEALVFSSALNTTQQGVIAQYLNSIGGLAQ